MWSACDAMLAGDTLVTRGSGCLFFICLYTVHSLRNGYRVFTTGCVASSSLGFPFVTLCTHFFGLARRDRPPKNALTVPFFSLTGSSFRSDSGTAPGMKRGNGSVTKDARTLDATLVGGSRTHDALRLRVRRHGPAKLKRRTEFDVIGPRRLAASRV